MRKKSFLPLIFYLLTLLLSDFSLKAEEQERGLSVVAKTLDETMEVGKQYLLLIAIDNYQHFQPLKNPVKDALDIRDILTKRYYIDVVMELYNEQATKENIIRTLNDLEQKLKPNDSLLVFYAGHGTFDRKTSTGFWLPVNAERDVFAQVNWLPNTQIHGLISKLPALHVLIISDSCFAGDIIGSSRSMERPDISIVPYMRKAYRRASRQVLTSGAMETVPDVSEFSRQLKFVLAKNKQLFMDTIMLFNEVRLGVRNTFPLFGYLKGTVHQEGGSFIFFLKDAPEKPIAYGTVLLSAVGGGELFVDRYFMQEIKPGENTLVEINVGLHIFEMHYAYEEKEILSVTVKEGETVSLSFVLRPRTTDKYTEAFTRSAFVTRVGFGLSFPVGDISQAMGMGLNPLIGAGFQFMLGPGRMYIGFEAGTEINATVSSYNVPYTLYNFPLCVFVSYAFHFGLGIYMFGELSGGYSFNLVMYKEDPLLINQEPGFFKPLALASLGAGIEIGKNLCIETAVSFTLIFFDVNPYIGFTPKLYAVWKF